jgi:hypothetical protein
MSVTIYASWVDQVEAADKVALESKTAKMVKGDPVEDKAFVDY